MRKSVALGCVVLCLSMGWIFEDAIYSPSPNSKDTSRSDSSLASSAAGIQQGMPGAGVSNSLLSVEMQKSRQEKIALLNARYEQAHNAYYAYRDETRYPFDSRPISEAPDQVRPFDPVVSEGPVRNERGEPVNGTTLRVGQDRVFLSGNDSVKFTVQAVDDKGKVLPLVVSRAAAQGVPDGVPSPQLRSTALVFSDNGQITGNAADATANDGVYSALLSPVSQGFSGFNGTIRTLLNVQVDGKEAVASIDVIYSDGVPATWGGIREAKENGALNFYLKATIAKAGRYLVSARIDDANGTPFAIVRFNDEVELGQQEFKLQLFGLLIRDKRPTFPLKLRDVSGHLLIPDSSPDRQMMAQRPGVVHTSRSYSIDSFSPDEWSSEQRDRYLTEYGKDLDRARAELNALGYK